MENNRCLYTAQSYCLLLSQIKRTYIFVCPNCLLLANIVQLNLMKTKIDHNISAQS